MATPNVQSIRVLVVDDETNVAVTIAAALEKLGDELVVDTAYGFREAFFKVRRTRYTLLIADYKMPDLSGIDLARAVRRVSPDTQILLMTAYGTPQLRDTARLLGFAGFLEKPFTLAQLRTLVQQIVSATTRRLLLMEDKDSSRRLYSAALRGAGYTVYEATSLQQARELLSRYRFDAFLCSLDIRGEHGMKLVRERAAGLGQSGTPVIAMSAEGGYRPICEEMGVEFYLETPIAIVPLVTLVDRLTAQQQPA